MKMVKRQQLLTGQGVFVLEWQNQSLFPFAIAIAWENKPKSVLVFSESRDIDNSTLSSCPRKKRETILRHGSSVFR